MGYGAGRTQWDVVYGPLSGHCLFADARRALFLSPSLLASLFPPRTGLELPLFYYFQTRHFFSKALSLSFSLTGRGGATLEKTCWKSHNRNVQPLLDIINVDRWTSLPWRRVNSCRSWREKLDRIFFHVRVPLLERCLRVRACS